MNDNTSTFTWIVLLIAVLALSVSFYTPGSYGLKRKQPKEDHSYKVGQLVKFVLTGEEVQIIDDSKSLGTGEKYGYNVRRKDGSVVHRMHVELAAIPNSDFNNGGTNKFLRGDGTWQEIPK